MTKHLQYLPAYIRLPAIIGYQTPKQSASLWWIKRVPLNCKPPIKIDEIFFYRQGYVLRSLILHGSIRIILLLLQGNPIKTPHASLVPGRVAHLHIIKSKPVLRERKASHGCTVERCRGNYHINILWEIDQNTRLFLKQRWTASGFMAYIRPYSFFDLFFGFEFDKFKISTVCSSTPSLSHLAKPQRYYCMAFEPATYATS